MTEQEILAIIENEFRAMRLPPPEHLRRGAQSAVWARIARRIVSECDSENRRAARAASMAGAMITRGRTRL